MFMKSIVFILLFTLSSVSFVHAAKNSEPPAGFCGTHLRKTQFTALPNSDALTQATESEEAKKLLSNNTQNNGGVAFGASVMSNPDATPEDFKNALYMQMMDHVFFNFMKTPNDMDPEVGIFNQRLMARLKNAEVETKTLKFDPKLADKSLVMKTISWEGFKLNDSDNSVEIRKVLNKILNVLGEDTGISVYFSRFENFQSDEDVTMAPFTQITFYNSKTGKAFNVWVRHHGADNLPDWDVTKERIQNYVSTLLPTTPDRVQVKLKGVVISSLTVSLPYDAPKMTGKEAKKLIGKTIYNVPIEKLSVVRDTKKPSEPYVPWNPPGSWSSFDPLSEDPFKPWNPTTPGRPDPANGWSSVGSDPFMPWKGQGWEPWVPITQDPLPPEVVQAVDINYQIGRGAMDKGGISLLRVFNSDSEVNLHELLSNVLIVDSNEEGILTFSCKEMGILTPGECVEYITKYGNDRGFFPFILYMNQWDSDLHEEPSFKSLNKTITDFISKTVGQDAMMFALNKGDHVIQHRTLFVSKDLKKTIIVDWDEGN